MKQLNQRNKLSNLFKNLALNKITKNRPKRTNYNGNGIQQTSIPMEIAYTVKQNTRQRTHVETAREYIGSFTILPTSAPGSSVVFMMNPLNLTGTRLNRIAANYQKYRFRRLAMTIQSSTTTSTNGLYIVGYNSNPDAELTPGTAIPQVYDLPGAQSTNVWRTITSVAKLEDRNKWYFLDEDSEEVMNTTQGYFALVVQSPTSATGPLTLPVMLDYTVEFTGSAYNPINANLPIIFPGGNWVPNPAANNDYVFTPSATEIAVPIVSTGTAYDINPSYPVTFVIGLETVSHIIRVVQRTASNWLFYASQDDYESGTNLKLTNAFITLRSTWTRLNLN